MAMTVFRETGETGPDGKPEMGPVSMRRVLSFLSFVVSAVMGVFAVAVKTPNWQAFVLCGIFAFFSLAMLILTSITDAKMIAAAGREDGNRGIDVSARALKS
jgi:VIT1/CCC1 family predicted Fe2+/Mn2+ transporter